MINLNVFVDDDFYAVLNCSDDGDLPNGFSSKDHKLCTVWENNYLDGGTGHIIELMDHQFYNNDTKEFDYVVARTLKTGKYMNGKEYRERCASKASDLVIKEWKSAYGRKVTFKLAD